MPEIISREKAKVLGLKRYFTGKPCSYGHIAEHYTGSKRCFVCYPDQKNFGESIACVICGNQFPRTNSYIKTCSIICRKEKQRRYSKIHSAMYQIIHRDRLRIYGREYMTRPGVRERYRANQRLRNRILSEKNKEMRVCPMCQGDFVCQKTQYNICCSNYCSRQRSYEIGKITGKAKNNQRNYRIRGQLALRALKELGIEVPSITPKSDVNSRGKRNQERKMFALKAIRELGISI